MSFYLIALNKHLRQLFKETTFSDGVLVHLFYGGSEGWSAEIENQKLIKNGKHKWRAEFTMQGSCVCFVYM